MAAAAPPPAYSASAADRTVHTYHLLNKEQHPWVTLTVRKSRAPDAALLPFFVQGDKIEGSVELDLAKELQIERVELWVMGSVTFAAADHFVFLEIRKELWASENGDPVLQSSAASCASSSSKASRLRGRFAFPFGVRLPSEVELGVKGMNGLRTWSLPPSFTERDSSAHVQYQIMIKIKRVVWPRLRCSSKLATSFGYIPLRRPDPPSALRQRAYRRNTPLTGLSGDPVGWRQLQPVTVRGNVFNSRVVEVVYTLCLANPLCYTRGTVIPCILTISTKDSQTLDLLSSTRSPTVRLMRKTSQSVVAEPKVSDEVKTASAEAAWWPSSGTNKDVLFGEIPLENILKPSCSVAYFKLSYHVVLFPPKSPGFQFSGSDSHSLLSQEVDIVAAYSDGPRPRKYTPSGYEREPFQPEIEIGTHMWRSMGSAIMNHGLTM